MKKACAVILAAGNGTRMQANENKVLMKFDDQSAVIRCLKTFAGTGLFSSFIIVCRADELPIIERKVADHVPAVQCTFCTGGSERQYSVENALQMIPDDVQLVAVHDAARCFITADIVEECMRCADEHGSGVVALEATDTVKRVRSGIVEETLDRTQLVCAQTPQAFDVALLRRAYDKAHRDSFLGTDDASLVERMGEPVYITRGSPENIKLTVHRDIEAGERILQQRRADDAARVGVGFDVHPFAAGRALILGGVEVPSPVGLAGHSDADVLIHAIMDAILGAAGLPDIGQCFPDDAPEFEGASSLGLLADVASRVHAEGYSICNVDAVLMMESPKIAHLKPAMIANIADALGLLPEQVNVKATTLEKLGALGREEGAGAHAVCLLRRSAANA